MNRVHTQARRPFVKRRAVAAETIFRAEVLRDGYPDDRALYEAMKDGKPVLR